MEKNKKGFSIIIAFWIVLIVTLIALYVLEYIIPFSKNVKGIENATKSYYLSLSWEEDALFYIRKHGLWAENIKSFSGPSSFAYTIFSSWSFLPAPWHGTSDFDKDWSKISPSNSVQIFLPTGINWTNIKIYFRVPYFSDNLEMSSVWAIINWQISAKTDILNSSSEIGQRFTKTDICDSSDTSCTWNSISWKQGFKLDNTTSTISSFYGSNCWVNYECVLKFSIINELIAKKLTSTIKIPYLEYKIDFDWKNVPSNVVRIDAKGSSYWFRKDFTLYYPRDFLINAYDFTVFQ